MRCAAVAGLLLAAVAHAGVSWESDLGKAKRRALKEEKLVFVIFVTKACEPYDEMEKDTLPRPDVQAWLGGLVCVKIDVETLEGDTLATRFGIAGVPTIAILAPTGDVLHKVGGRPAPEEFVDYFAASEYNAAVDACNLRDPRGAAPHLFFVRKWFGSTEIGKKTDELYRSVENEEGFKAAYEAAAKAYEDGLAAARAAEAARVEQARAAERKDEERRAKAKALKAEADDLYKKYMRTKAFDTYRRIIADYPDLPEAKEATEILKKYNQKLTK